ncbi:MAG: DUF2333 family protein [Candidatus Sungbacteria bacterium]|nr:DUF2333 family protein [Candidatus Sungbacteria bacterium]
MLWFRKKDAEEAAGEKIDLFSEEATAGEKSDVLDEDTALTDLIGEEDVSFWHRIGAALWARKKIVAVSLAAFLTLGQMLEVVVYGWVPTTIPTVTLKVGPNGEKLAEGTTFVSTLRDMMREQLDSGWVLNDMWPFAGYRRKFQEGLSDYWGSWLFILNLDMARVGGKGRADPRITATLRAVTGYSDSWLFPPAEWKLQGAVGNLDSYIADMQKREIFFPRGNNLHEFMKMTSGMLSTGVGELTEENDIGFLMGYKPFQRNQGLAYGVKLALETVKVDLADIIARKGGGPQLDKAIKYLEQALAMSPWIVSNGEWGIKSDVSTLANLLSNAQSLINDLADTLRNA